MIVDDWYKRPLDHRAPAGGEVGCDGKARKGGEFEPFYVPRPVMPQIDRRDLPALLAFAKRRGVKVRKAEMPASLIRPHQRVEVSRAISMSPATLRKRLLISREPFVLDGHHRLYELQRLGLPARVLEFGLEFEQAVAFLFSFPRTYAYGDGKPHPESA